MGRKELKDLKEKAAPFSLRSLSSPAARFRFVSIGVHSWFLSACFAYFAVSSSAAVFTTNALISEANTTFDGQDIVIDGNITVTTDGPHTFAALLLTNGAVLTHSPCTTNATHNVGLRANKPLPFLPNGTAVCRILQA